MRALRHHLSYGFTLVEMLASMMVLALLMVITFGVFNQASKAWLLAENRTEAFQGSRMALDLMARDLEGAIVGVHTNFPGSYPSVTRLPFLTFEDSGSAYLTNYVIGGMPAVTFSSVYTNVNSTSPNDAIFFITQTPDSKGNQWMDLAECGYYIGFCSNTSGSGGMRKGYYYLIRHYAKSSQSGTWDIISNPNNWWNAGSQTPLLDNALRLEMFYEYDTGAGLAWVNNWNTFSGAPLASVVPDPTVQLPRAVTIQLSLIDRRTATRLAALTGNSGLSSTELGYVPFGMDSIANAAVKRTLKESVRTFYRTVYLRGSL